MKKFNSGTTRGDGHKHHLKQKRTTAATPKSSRRGLNLICRDTISQDFIVSEGITSSCTAVTGVALDGIDSAVLDLLNDTNMVRQPILRTRLAIRRILVEEDNHAKCWFEAFVCPLTTCLEPVDAVDATGKLGNDANVNIATLVSTLVSTPANKASTPSYTRSETIPTPVRHATYVTNLRNGNSNDLIVFAIDAI